MMIQKISIKNFKSIKSIEFDTGQVNVIIGENGSGKSNILEGIALGGAAASDLLTNQFLFSRGIRIQEGKHIFHSNQKTIFIEFNEILTENFTYQIKYNNKEGLYDHFSEGYRNFVKTNLKDLIKKAPDSLPELRYLSETKKEAYLKNLRQQHHPRQSLPKY